MGEPSFTEQWFNEFKRINMMIHEHMERQFRPFGITGEQVRVLYILTKQGPMTLTNLSTILRVTKGGCSTLCRRMEHAGFLTLSRNEKDGRLLIVSLSEKGILTLNQLQKVVISDPVSGVSDEDKELILKGLQCLEKYLRR